ncbi:MAG: PRC-barrel domain containing protein [Ignavibacteria bacterium]|jgi:sporulation protein YlmC with PRC-barrel domain|nr:PRC-barrel domain containing protein [Ignavibacteria bacterium]MCU7503404.1 PRC-barrel domain containing protein [Ignavibacteria bacterium]MCU7516264.1 PRC-barrel domain containing protein [Ignavibacteria bacterium]
MLRSIKEVEKYRIIATDGEIGDAYDLYFDDVKWTIRYLIVETGGWLSKKQVLISPFAITKTDWQEKKLSLNLTQKQIENSPDVSTDEPVSRQNEIDLMKYYNWPRYWDWGEAGLPYTPGAASFMASGPILNEGEVNAQKKEETQPQGSEKKGDPHLRSSREIIGYKIQATDTEIGRVEDFILDDATWIIRYIVVDTGNWLTGSKKFLVAPHWIEKVQWAESKVHVALKSEDIKNSPPYDPSQTLNRDYEKLLYEHYGLPKYWI